MPEKFYQLKKFLSPSNKRRTKRITVHTCANSSFPFVSSLSCFSRRKKSRIEIQTKKRKRSSLSYVRRGEAKMAVHAKTFESHPLREFYLKGSKTNGGRLGRSFKVKRGSETRLTTCGALFFFCFFNFFFY
jgi:hypothetical protein